MQFHQPATYTEIAFIDEFPASAPVSSFEPHALPLIINAATSLPVVIFLRVNGLSSDNTSPSPVSGLQKAYLQACRLLTRSSSIVFDAAILLFIKTDNSFAVLVTYHAKTSGIIMSDIFVFTILTVCPFDFT
jgi:hypothetical protein